MVCIRLQTRFALRDFAAATLKEVVLIEDGIKNHCDLFGLMQRNGKKVSGGECALTTEKETVKKGAETLLLSCVVCR